MQKFLTIACVLLVCATASRAQSTDDYPKYDLTAGYTVNFSDLKGRIILGRETLNGFTVAPALNLSKNFAVEGDVTYTTKTFGGGFGFPGVRANLWSYLAGPRYTMRSPNNKLQPFVHALLGGAHASASSIRENGFATKLGGGLDIVAGKHFAVRAFQADYYLTRFAGQNSNNVTLTFGIRLF